MRFSKTTPDAAARAITERLANELAANKRVLWLVSGGSNIALEVAIMKALPAALQPHLAVMLTDERYGPFGHPDSNFQQLYSAGFAPGHATVVPVLTPEELSFKDAAARYEQAVTTAFGSADAIIVQLGMGSDGHVLGVLPDSAAVSSRKLVTSYRSDPYQRITTTLAALKKATAVYTLAFGEAKRPQLLNLRDKNLPLKTQPAQILKQIPESYMYNDQVEATH